MAAGAVLSDFPKIECPLVRRLFQADKQQLWDWARQHRARPCRDGLVYLATPEINPGYEWVFQDPEVIATEKLDGTNIKILVQDGRVAVVQNRANPPLDLLNTRVDNTRYAEGVLHAIAKGYLKEDGEYAGELIGPSVNTNLYQLDRHEWYPFDRAVESLRYKSFNEHPRTFENWQNWFGGFLRSLYYAKRKKIPIAESILAEGVVFYHLRRRAEGQWPWMAKLRRDMFRFFYEAVTIGAEPVGGNVSPAME